MIPKLWCSDHAIAEICAVGFPVSGGTGSRKMQSPSSRCEHVARFCSPSLATQGTDWTNLIAPEHLTTTREKLPGIVSAGSIFIGDYSAQAAGITDPGRTMCCPLAGSRVSAEGLSVADFVKIMTVQEISRKGLRKIAPSILTLAEAEGLKAHARSIELRYGHA